MPNEPPSLLSCRVAPPPLSSSRRNIGPLSLLCDEIRTREAEIDWRVHYYPLTQGAALSTHFRVRPRHDQSKALVSGYSVPIPTSVFNLREASCACGPFSVCCPSLVSFFTLSLSPKSRVERAAATAKRRSNYCGKTHTHCFFRQKAVSIVFHALRTRVKSDDSN